MEIKDYKNDKREVLLIDMDDTINNLKSVWCQKINQKFNTNLILDEINDWKIHKFVKDKAKEDVYELLKIPGLFLNLTPPDNCVQVISYLNEYFQIYFCTSCIFPENYIEKKLYIEKWFPFIDLDNIIITKNKSLIKGVYMIDDYYENLRNFEGKKILINKEHNKSIKDIDLTSVCIVYNWLQIFDFFLEDNYGFKQFMINKKLINIDKIEDGKRLYFS